MDLTALPGRPASIIGCGIAGPALALFLQQAGFAPTIYEGRPTPDDHAGAFLNLSPNGLNVLRLLGLYEAVQAAGYPCQGITFHNARGQTVGRISADDDELPRYGARSVIIKRGVLHQLLREAARQAGIPIVFGKQLVGIEPAADGMQACFADGSAAPAALLLGCDGLHSRTRQLLFPHAPAPAYQGLVDSGGFVPNQLGLAPTRGLHMTFGRQAFLGYFVTPDNEVWWFSNEARAQAPARGELAALTAEASQAHLLALHAPDPAPIPAIVAAIAGPVSRWPIYDLEFLPTWHRGPACLLGDAAHATSPHAGQGASLALEDAAVLAQCLRDAPEPTIAFRTFERLRKPRVEAIIRQARRAGGSKKPPGPLAAWLRDQLLPVFLKLGAKSLEKVYAYRIDWEKRL